MSTGRVLFLAILGFMMFIGLVASLASTGTGPNALETPTATVGTTLPLYWKAGDRIGLPPQGSAEKRHAYVSGRHARTAENEVANWARSAAEAKLAPPYDPRWPVAVIVTGGRGLGPEWNAARRVPERASRFGTFEAVDGASHTTILGEVYGDAGVRGVEYVLAHMAQGR